MITTSKKFNRLFFTFFFLFILTASHAQTQKSGFQFEKIQHKVSIGYTIGATAPLSMPNTIRKIERYTPLFTPSIGYEAQYQLSEKWALGTGLRFESKGMKIVDSVQYFHTMITVDNGDGGDDGSFEGDFTGKNRTTAKFTYLTLPIFSEYRFQKWNVRTGIYVAYLLSGKFEGEVYDGYIRKENSMGEKVLIKRATFDFEDEIKTWDAGLNIGTSRKIGNQWEIFALGQLGLRPIFAKEFRGVGYDLHQIHATIGGIYKLR